MQTTTPRNCRESLRPKQQGSFRAAARMAPKVGEESGDHWHHTMVGVTPTSAHFGSCRQFRHASWPFKSHCVCSAIRQFDLPLQQRSSASDYCPNQLHRTSAYFCCHLRRCPAPGVNACAISDADFSSLFAALSKPPSSQSRIHAERPIIQSVKVKHPPTSQPNQLLHVFTRKPTRLSRFLTFFAFPPRQRERLRFLRSSACFPSRPSSRTIASKLSPTPVRSDLLWPL
jgi:hypothetical protein